MGAGGVAMIDLFVFQRLCIRFGEWWFVMEVLDSSCFGWRFWRIGAGGFAMIDLFFSQRLCIISGEWWFWI